MHYRFRLFSGQLGQNPILVLIMVLLAWTPLSAWSMSQSGMGVTVEEVYVRAVPPGQKNTGVFMTLKNPSATDQSLVNATSNASKIVELHTHINDNGMMRMRRIDSIDIPANGQTLLKPGGLHVMLIDLNQEIIEGEPVELTLEFADGSRQTIQAIGRKLQMKMKKMH